MFGRIINHITICGSCGGPYTYHKVNEVNEKIIISRQIGNTVIHLDVIMFPSALLQWRLFELNEVLILVE